MGYETVAIAKTANKATASDDSGYINQRIKKRPVDRALPGFELSALRADKYRVGISKMPTKSFNLR